MRRTCTGTIPTDKLDKQKGKAIRKACVSIINQMSIEEIQHLFEVTEAQLSEGITEIEVSLLTAYGE